MTSIDRSAPIAPAAAAGPLSYGGDARGLAGAAIGEIGHRLLAWVAASGGDAMGTAAWARTAGGAGDFRPDADRLAQRGDVHDVDGLARAIARPTGATPTQEGDLRRALVEFARAAMVQVAGLSGAAGDRQVAGLRDALAAAMEGGAAIGAEGVIERVDWATAALTLAHGG